MVCYLVWTATEVAGGDVGHHLYGANRGSGTSGVGMDEHTHHGTATVEACPTWCIRQHSSRDHPEDALHQSRPRYAALVTGRPWLAGAGPAPSPVVARLVQPVGSTPVWLEVTSEEGDDVDLCLTVESARQLVVLLESLLEITRG